MTATHSVRRFRQPIKKVGRFKLVGSSKSKEPIAGRR
jgi:hypothetical protein